MTMSIQLSNKDSPVGDVIKQELQNADSVQIAVAFLKYSGVKAIEKSLEQCLNNDGTFEMIVGLDFQTTDPTSIGYFINLKKQYPKVTFYCFGDNNENETNIVFHPKIYLFENAQVKTGIVGSSNLTRGGLYSNLEVNTIFKEIDSLYYPQLQAIYNSIKNVDSVFMPDEEYLTMYSEVYQEFSKGADNAKNKGLQEAIKKAREKEKTLPGAPTLKKLIIDVIKSKQESGQEFVSLPEIYEALEKIAADKNLNYKKDTFRNSIRGELNHHEVRGNSERNMHLFIRSEDNQGFYALTDEGKNYQGR
ncbi:MAG: phospholipase D family protein [Proteobacteria bacterium]|nr:phospholipase D family protein [Pseudomonadota bacterium]